MEDRKLIEACLAQDRKAQKQLYDRYSGQMYSLCLRYCKNEQDAQDALQKGFINVFTYLHMFRNEGTLDSWIRKIMVRASLEQLQMNSKHKSHGPVETEIESNGTDYIKEKMTYEQMIKWLDLLPPGYRNIFSMYVLDDFSHGEIAKILGITESTSRTQFFKARKFLQEKLSHVLNQYV